jgi:hypothetical protein
MTGIRYEGEERRAARIIVRPKSEFRTILRIFNAIQYPETGNADERISFALLELVSNSMRAQIERGREEPILVRIWIEEGRMMIKVADHGGGFDPSSLPYSFNAPVESLDMMSPEFIAYRERFDNTRFGMGLVAVRKIFPFFSLRFVDDTDTELPWPSPKIEGTIITLGVPLHASVDNGGILH